MDEIARRMAAITWTYGDKDPQALAVLEGRIAETGRNLGLITYSDLVKGVTFHLPNIRHGDNYQIAIYDWSGLDRTILGDFLGYISTRSYLQAEVMASALVVNRFEYRPSEHFFEWMKALAVLPDTHEDTVLAFWAGQVNKAHNWFQAKRR